MRYSILAFRPLPHIDAKFLGHVRVLVFRQMEAGSLRVAASSAERVTASPADVLATLVTCDDDVQSERQLRIGWGNQCSLPIPTVIDLRRVPEDHQAAEIARAVGQDLARLLDRTSRMNNDLRRELIGLRREHEQAQRALVRLESFLRDLGLAPETLLLDVASSGQAIRLRGRRSERLVQLLPINPEGLSIITLRVEPERTDPYTTVETTLFGRTTSVGLLASWRWTADQALGGSIDLQLPQALNLFNEDLELRLEVSGAGTLALCLGRRHPRPEFWVELIGTSEETQPERSLALQLRGSLPLLSRPPRAGTVLADGAGPRRRVTYSVPLHELAGFKIVADRVAVPHPNENCRVVENGGFLVQPPERGPIFCRFTGTLPVGVEGLQASVVTRDSRAGPVEYIMAAVPRHASLSANTDFEECYSTGWVSFPSATLSRLTVKFGVPLSECRDLVIGTRVATGMRNWFCRAEWWQVAYSMPPSAVSAQPPTNPAAMLKKAAG